MLTYKSRHSEGGVISLKTKLSRFLPILAGFVAGLMLSGVLYAATGFAIFGRWHETPLPYADASNAKLTALAFDILENIKKGDYRALSRSAHPDYGVMFSPCATVSLSANKCFNAKQIAAFETDTNTYVWGIYSVSGEPIEMTPAAYFSKFVFDKDYTTASVIGVNRVVRQGNALENITEVFPDVLFVDFHFPGGDRFSSDDQNWSSLRLGFEEYDGTLMLTVILHSEWTA